MAAHAAQREAEPRPGQRGQPGARRFRAQHRHLPGQGAVPEAAARQRERALGRHAAAHPADPGVPAGMLVARHV